MKKILILASFILLSSNLYAKQSFDEKVVNEYLTIAHLLTYGTHLGDKEEKLDAIKYAKKALKWMEENKKSPNMGLDSPLAGKAYYQIGAAMGHDKNAKEYVLKSYETYKKSLGENHPKTKEIKMILRDFY